jgi:protein PhnA
MNIEKELQQRSEMKCELCGGTNELAVYEVQPVPSTNLDSALFACQICRTQIENPEQMDANHWRCLNESMWSTVPGVQVMAWRMLNRLRAEGWPQDLLDMLYLDDESLAWAQATGEGPADEDAAKHIDSNGAELQSGDTVTLIKDLDVKGANFTAKRGTTVKNIRLVEDNSEQIEGKVDGQQIVILTKFVKKA